MATQCDRVRPQKQRRVISKSGEKNLNFANLPQRSKRFFQDFVTTIIETRWRVVVCAYLISTFGCWSIFGMLWYLISHSHNDLYFDSKTATSLHEGKMKCIEGVESWTSYFLLSFEIQTTVGFGERYPNEECPEAIFMFMAQIVMGVLIDGAMIGFIFAKLKRPPRKPYDLKFSRKAVVCLRDSKLCLMFRICDPNEIHVIDSMVQACIFGELSSIEGELLNQFQHSLKLENDGRVLVIFPLVVSHVIDIKSPLYTFCAKTFLEKRFEIIVTFTGASPSTGQTTEERTSYLSTEIEWGHQFVNMVEYDRENREYFVDYDKFDETELVETPLCSAERFDEVKEEIEHYSNLTNEQNMTNFEEE